MSDKYQHYWEMKNRQDSYKPLDWDRIITYVIIYPFYVLFAVCFVLAKGFS